MSSVVAEPSNLTHATINTIIASRRDVFHYLEISSSSLEASCRARRRVAKDLSVAIMKPRQISLQRQRFCLVSHPPSHGGNKAATDLVEQKTDGSSSQSIDDHVTML